MAFKKSNTCGVSNTRLYFLLFSLVDRPVTIRQLSIHGYWSKFLMTSCPGVNQLQIREEVLEFGNLFTIVIIYFFKLNFFNAQLGLEVCPYGVSPHIPEHCMPIQVAICKASSFISSFTHSLLPLTWPCPHPFNLPEDCFSSPGCS